MNRFVTDFQRLSAARTPLCVGLDPSEDLFRIWGLDATADGLRRFCGTVLEAAGDLVAVIKPQMAFFERFGPEGMTEFASALAGIGQCGALSLIDAKRGDIPGTMTGYAAAYLGRRGGFAGDAVTLAPYLGLEALHPALEQARVSGTGAFVVVRSSNPEGASVQEARLPDGRTVAEGIADGITAFMGVDEEGVGPVGAVIGATLDPSALRLLERLPRSLILAPGVGAQGASLSDLRRMFACAPGRVLPAVSRGVLRHGPSVGDLRDQIRRYQDAVAAAMIG